MEKEPDIRKEKKSAKKRKIRGVISQRKRDSHQGWGKILLAEREIEP